ncbi:DNase I-like protein [Exidia glandulosa HHB12029]|uniref:DNase I-like protein n=1 Tax=Exidia glandulosa HHB12029 TaxID=1314781 RepID=A0A165BN44_EXIGL|nr:DNase I-like protein [Exidia glandulosa HHB12029]
MSKWDDVERHMRKEKIGILAVQETHLSDELIANVNQDHEEIKLFCSPNPENPTGRGGVGIVLNKRLVRIQEARMWEIIPGRAIVVSIDWHRQQKLTVLAVYAPNDHRENKEFWTNIREKLELRADIPRPKAMLGDFNMVESSADRLPAHLNNADMTAEFQELLTFLRVVDGWREINPRRFVPTWHDAAAETFARLDRIYVTEQMFVASRNWKCETISNWCPGADHLPVSVDLVNPAMPYVGEGIWSMGLQHLRDKQLFREIIQTGIEMLKEADELTAKPRLPEHNVQHLVADWKVLVGEKSRQRAREEGQKRERILRSLENEKKEILQDAADGEIDRKDLPFEVLDIEDRIAAISKRQKKRKKENARARRRLFHETNSKEWWKAGREKRTAEIIPFLRDTRPEGERLADRRRAERPERQAAHAGGGDDDDGEYVSRTDEMVDILRSHHDSLQDKDVHPDEAEREEKIREVLEHIKTRLGDNHCCGQQGTGVPRATGRNTRGSHNHLPTLSGGHPT